MPDPEATSLSSSSPQASGGREAISELLGERYEIIRKLGAGAFGEVYEAQDTSLGRRVAIKRIRLDVLAEGPELEEAKQRFLLEARVAAKLRHPNIVTIHDIASKGNSSFTVMELVEGRTLQQLLRERERLGLEETLQILAQAAAALDFAHAQGVVHRDVKPANLMLDASGQVKVMDFGIAKDRSSGNLTKTGTILGTPNYMSPEQARGAAVDGRADLFSLACVLYECLFGRRPFAGDSVTAILMKILTEDPPAIDLAALQLPAPLSDVLRRALAKDPAARFASGRLLAEALASAAGRVPAPTAISPSPPTLAAATLPAAAAPPTLQRKGAVAPESIQPPPLPRPARRRGPLLVGATLLGLLLALGLLRAAGPLTGAASVFGGVRSEPVSRFVTRQQPGVVARLLGARPRLRITVPEATLLRLRLETPLSSETAQVGQEVLATTTAPVAIDEHEVFPAGARVRGHVAHAAPSGKVSGRGELTVEFDRISGPDGRELALETESVQRKARSATKKDATKVAGGAGVGAIVGGLLGGKKGAVIGGLVGGSAGAGAALATKGEEVVLPEGSAFAVHLRAPLTVTLEPKAP